MQKLIALLAAAMLILTAFAQAEEGQQAPDYLLEGFDDANHDWENNLFFQRMQEETGISFMFREHTDKDE